MKTIYDQSYFDDYGLMRMEKGIDTENGILFLAYLIKLRLLNGKSQVHMKSSLKGAFFCSTWVEDDYRINYQANPPQKGEHFSRDNMWGMYWLSEYLFGDCDSLPIIYWNGKINFHPNTWAVFLSLKFKLLAVLLYPLVKGMQIYSKLTRDGAGDTSGTLLWWLLYGDETDDKLDDFIYYVTLGWSRDNYDNPILIEANELWGSDAKMDM